MANGSSGGHALTHTGLNQTTASAIMHLELRGHSVMSTVQTVITEETPKTHKLHTSICDGANMYNIFNSADYEVE